MGPLYNQGIPFSVRDFHKCILCLCSFLLYAFPVSCPSSHASSTLISSQIPPSKFKKFIFWTKLNVQIVPGTHWSCIRRMQQHNNRAYCPRLLSTGSTTYPMTTSSPSALSRHNTTRSPPPPRNLRFLRHSGKQCRYPTRPLPLIKSDPSPKREEW